MKYNWPLVMIGGTLLVLGTALPSFLWRSASFYAMGGAPPSGYSTGVEAGGILWAVSGGFLVFIALLARGHPYSRGVAFLVLVACGLLYLGVLRIPPCNGSYSCSPAFGVGVSVAGAVLSIIGSLMPLSAGDTIKSPGIVLPLVLELVIICAGLALVAHPLVGDWLGLWHTPLSTNPCKYMLCAVDKPAACTSRKASCYATVTVQAIELTPPPWWP